MSGRRKGRSATTSSQAIPAAFATRAAALLGDEWPLLEAALDAPVPVSIRHNPAKHGGPPGTPVPWCSTGTYLEERPTFTLDPFLHAGAYYVQEASSMLLEQALRASGLLEQPIVALDLCAAPGGKTTLLRSLLHANALVVANELERRRQPALQENLWKWGLPNSAVSGSDPEDLLRVPETFDLILVDAPCSGEGMFRKTPFAREQWNEGLVLHCATLQERIVESAWQALKPGGILIYSTCTWEAAENEDRLLQLRSLGAVAIPLHIDPAWGITPTGTPHLPGYRCYPHRVKGEGFFLGMVRKPGKSIADAVSSVPAEDHPEVRSWSPSGKHWHLTEKDAVLHAVDGRWKNMIRTLSGSLRMIAPGRPVAENKGGTWRPHAALALDTTLDRGAFPEVSLDRSQALRYLKGEALLGTDTQGTALAVYDDLPLGWLKGGGNRWNNLWPAPWRIRMQTT